jgi:hypothetical protein
MKIIGYKGHTIIVERKKRYIKVTVTGPHYRADYRSTLTLTNGIDYLADVEMKRVQQTLDARG